MGPSLPAARCLGRVTGSGWAWGGGKFSPLWVGEQLVLFHERNGREGGAGRVPGDSWKDVRGSWEADAFKWVRKRMLWGGLRLRAEG